MQPEFFMSTKGKCFLILWFSKNHSFLKMCVCVGGGSWEGLFSIRKSVRLQLQASQHLNDGFTSSNDDEL